MSVYSDRAQATYRSDGLTTASPGKLLVMLYDRFLLDLDRADALIDAGKIANEPLLHAQDIVTELRCSLRPDLWDGADNLAGIYTFVLTELVWANVKSDKTRIAACRALMTPLRDAWAQIAEGAVRATAQYMPQSA